MSESRINIPTDEEPQPDPREMAEAQRQNQIAHTLINLFSLTVPPQVAFNAGMGLLFSAGAAAGLPLDAIIHTVVNTAKQMQAQITAQGGLVKPTNADVAKVTGRG